MGLELDDVGWGKGWEFSWEGVRRVGSGSWGCRVVKRMV